MKLLAHFGSIFARFVSILRGLFDSVDINRVIRCEATNHNADDGILRRISHQQLSHESSGFVRAVTGSHDVLNSNLIGRSFAHAKKGGPSQPSSCASTAAISIGKVADFMSDYEGEFPWRPGQNSHQSDVDHDCMCAQIGERINISFQCHLDGEFWHGVLPGAVLRACETYRRIVYEVFCFFQTLPKATRREQHNPQSKNVFHGFLSLLRHENWLRSLIARLGNAPRAYSQNDGENQSAQWIVRALATARSVVVQGYSRCDAATHGAGIVLRALALGNGTFVPRRVGETA